MVSKTLFVIPIILAIPHSAKAGCTSPIGSEGAMTYNYSYHVLQYCNNNDAWVSMAAGSTEVDPKIGTLTAPDFCTTNGTTVNCTAPAINLASKVAGNLPVSNLNGGTNAAASTFWRGDGTWSTTPTTQDARIGTLMTGDYCRANTTGTVINCTSQ